MPVQLDMSTAQPIQSGGVKLDMSTARPIAPPAAGPHVDMQEMNLLDSSNAGHPAEGVAPAGKLTHLPGVDPHTPTTMEGFGDASLAAAPMLATATVPQVVRGAIAATMGAQVGKKGAEVLGLGKTGQDFAEAGGGIAGGGLGVKAPEVWNAGRGALAEAMATRTGRSAGVIADAVGKLPVVDKFVNAGKALGRLSDIWGKQPTYPGAPLPETPAPEVLQAGALQTGGTPVVDAASGLGKMPAAQQSAAAPPPPKPTPRPIAKGQWGKAMDEQLGKALGAKPLDPKVPLRSQMPGRMPEAAESAELLEGHVPTESSWIKSYKYDPAKREFEMHPKSGNAVRLGDVSPEDAKAFIDSQSKGTAWQQMKRNPAVAKRINGKWIPTKPSAKEPGQ